MHVHDHQDAQVVIRGDRAGQQTQDRQPHQIRLQRGFEDIELAEKAAGERNADHREQKDCE